MKRSDLSGQTLSALFWAFSGSTVQYVLRTAILIVLARLLAPADFGLLSAALIVAQFTEIFALLGVGPAIVQRPDLNDNHLRTGFTSSVLFGTLLAGVIWLLAPGIASFFETARVTAVLRAIVVVFPLSGLTVVADSLMRRELQFRRLAGIEVVAYVISNGVIGISMALLGFGVWALVGAYIAQEIVRAIAVLAVRPHPKRPQLNAAALKDLFSFGAGQTLGNVFNYFATQGDNLVVGRWLGVEALGLYGRAFNFMRIPVAIIGSVLGKVLFPVMSKVQDDPARLVSAYRRGTALVGLVILPMSVVLWVVAPELVYVLLGPAWGGVVAPFQILVAGMLFRTSYIISAALTRAKGAVYRHAWRQALYALVVVAGAWLGQHWGLAGVASGVLVALAIHFLLMTQLALSMVSLGWREVWAMHVPAVLVSLVVGVVAWGVAALLRQSNAAPLLLLASSGLAVAATGTLLIRFFPLAVLGRDGVWLIQTLLRRLPKNLFFATWLTREFKWTASHD